MRLSYIKEFIEFSSDLNFTAAARRLNLSVSALSTHISNLEDELGVELVNRQTRKLTSEGRVFLDYAYRMTDLYSEAYRKCHEIAAKNTGSLKIDKIINSSATGYCFREFIFEFSDKNSGVNVQLIQSINTSFVESLRDGNVDVAMVATLAPDAIIPMLEKEGILCIPIGEEEITAWVSMKSAAGKEEMLHLEDLGKYAIAHSQQWRLDIWRASLKYLLDPIGATPNIRLNFFANLTDYALENIPDDEISLISISTAEHSGLFRLRKDRECKFFDPPLYISTFVCYRKDDTNPVLLQFIDALKERFAHCKDTL